MNQSETYFELVIRVVKQVEGNLLHHYAICQVNTLKIISIILPWRYYNIGAGGFYVKLSDINFFAIFAECGLNQ